MRAGIQALRLRLLRRAEVPVVAVPFLREEAVEYGSVKNSSPMIRRVVAANPGAFTYHGTGTYIIGSGQVAVVDPGPALPPHVDAILAATRGERITHILVTHTHLDHSPATRALQARVAAPSYGYGPHGTGRFERGEQVEEGADWEFAPDVEVRDGDVVQGVGWSVECVHTPGHTSNHICYRLREEASLFCGDHVMGWSTTIVSPPDGDMGEYMRSLERLLARDDACYWPTHGPGILDPQAFVRACIEHRRERFEQILQCLSNGVSGISDMVPIIYRDLPRSMHPAAARQVFAALLYLVDEGRATCAGSLGVDARYHPAL